MAEEALLAFDRVLAAGLNLQVSQWRGPGALNGHPNEVWGLALSPDGRTLVSSSNDSTIKLRDVASGTEQQTLRGDLSLAKTVAYSPDGKLLASAGWDNKIRLWKACGGALLATLEGLLVTFECWHSRPRGTC